MRKVLYIILFFLLQGCHTSGTFTEQSLIFKGEIKGYQFDEHTLVLNKGDIITASLDSNVISIVLFSPINTTLEIGKPVTIEKSGEYIIRVLLPRAFARRNETHGYQLLINIEAITNN